MVPPCTVQGLYTSQHSTTAAAPPRSPAGSRADAELPATMLGASSCFSCSALLTELLLACVQSSTLPSICVGRTAASHVVGTCHPLCQLLQPAAKTETRQWAVIEGRHLY
jgi:hypothetical protein